VPKFKTSHYERGVIIGVAKIAEVMGCESSTIYRWEKSYGFPLGTLPDGRRITTTSLIDGWIMASISNPPFARTRNLEVSRAIQEHRRNTRRMDQPSADGDGRSGGHAATPSAIRRAVELAKAAGIDPDDLDIEAA
jgi:hypothetical protein